MKKRKTHIAIAYDFDGTLAPGNMQEHSFIPNLKINNKQFWKEVKDYARKHDMNEILAYMQLMLRRADEKNMQITRQAFKTHGKGIALFNGVVDWFDIINKYATSRGASVDHYIISSGLRDIIKGTSIWKHFSGVFASGYVFDANNVAVWPALAVDYTSKTQYLFRINKGINNSWDNTKINKYYDDKDKPMPFSNMIYLGDGETDVPAMKMTKHQGGTAIAVYDPNKRKSKHKSSPKQACEELIEQKRADYISPADYSVGKPLMEIVKLSIDRIVAYSQLKKYKK